MVELFRRRQFRQGETPVPAPRRYRRALILLSSGSVVLAVLYATSLTFDFTPGAVGQPPSSWPATTRLQRSSGPTMILFLHSCCPCSRATLRELDALLTKFPANGRAYCVVLKPAACDRLSDEITESVRSLPRIRLVEDDDRLESARFGVHTSGHVLFYDAAGKLRFSGGVTPSRGHEGSNSGTDALAVLFQGRQANVGQAPVFGCRLPSLKTGPQSPVCAAEGGH
jgi:hypothetical protein